jgi:hypothetical protein
LEDVVEDTRTDGDRHSGRLNCTGSEDVTRERRYAPRAFRDATRTSHLVRHRRYPYVRGAACSPTLGVSPPLSRLGAPGSPPLARTGARPSLALWIGEPPAPRHRSRNRRRYFRSRNPPSPQPLAGGPSPRELSGNRHRRTRLGGYRRS